MNVSVPILSLVKKKDGDVSDDQLLYGWSVKSSHCDGILAYAESYMGYGGFVLQAGLAKGDYKYNGIVKSGSCGAYTAPTFKSRSLFTLFGGSLLKLEGSKGEFLTVTGVLGENFYVHKSAVSPIPRDFSPKDAVSYGLSYLGAPYFWGGKTVTGIDCSGLAAMSYFLAGAQIYRDSDPSRSPLYPAESPTMGDLVYLKGHVGLCIDERNVIHASWSAGRVIISPLKSFTENADYIGIFRYCPINSKKGIAFL